MFFSKGPGTEKGRDVLGGFKACQVLIRSTHGRLLALVVSLFPLLAGDLEGCSVPVFRYALERWVPDSYNVFIFHRGGLSVEQQGLVDRLNSKSMSKAGDVNLSLTRIDVADSMEPESMELWEAQGTQSLPWMMVSFPWKRFAPDSLWSGPMTKDSVDRLLDSPVRREVARRLLQGDSAVWVLLESGDSAKDEAAMERLNARLKHLESTLELPVLNPEDIEEGLISIKEDQLKIGFSTIRLSRDDPYETFFVRNLLGSEDDLTEYDEPIAFPIFGRGRVLYGLIGAGIAPDVIDDASLFLTGACSCEVKEQNPGVDLLMSVGWDRLITTQYDIDRELPPLSGFVGMSDQSSMASPLRNEAVPVPEGATTVSLNVQSPETDLNSSKVEKRIGSIVLNTLVVCSVVGIGAFGAGVFLLRRRPNVT